MLTMCHFIVSLAAITVYFKKSTYAIKNKWVKVCLKKIGIHGFPITVLLHHLDPKGTAQVISCIVFTYKFGFRIYNVN